MIQSRYIHSTICWLLDCGAHTAQMRARCKQTPEHVTYAVSRFLLWFVQWTEPPKCNAYATSMHSSMTLIVGAHRAQAKEAQTLCVHTIILKLMLVTLHIRHTHKLQSFVFPIQLVQCNAIVYCMQPGRTGGNLNAPMHYMDYCFSNQSQLYVDQCKWFADFSGHSKLVCTGRKLNDDRDLDYIIAPFDGCLYTLNRILFECLLWQMHNWVSVGSIGNVRRHRHTPNKILICHACAL